MSQKSTRRPRRKLTPEFKAKVALAALREDKTLTALAAEHDVHANQIIEWKNALLSNASSVFGAQPVFSEAQMDAKVKALQAKIGQITMENDFLETALTKAGLLSARR